MAAYRRVYGVIYLTLLHQQDDCLYTGISSGPSLDNEYGRTFLFLFTPSGSSKTWIHFLQLVRNFLQVMALRHQDRMASKPNFWPRLQPWAFGLVNVIVKHKYWARGLSPPYIATQRFFPLIKPEHMEHKQQTCEAQLRDDVNQNRKRLLASCSCSNRHFYILCCKPVL